MRPTIEELENLLKREDEPMITILPDGSVAEFQGPPPPRKPVTFGQSLGGEY